MTLKQFKDRLNKLPAELDEKEVVVRRPNKDIVPADVKLRFYEGESDFALTKENIEFISIGWRQIKPYTITTIPFIFDTKDEDTSEDKNPEYEEFMDKYKEEHKYCPKCGSVTYSTTFLNYFLDLNNPQNYKDENSCICVDCNHMHIMHDRVSFNIYKERKRELVFKQKPYPGEEYRKIIKIIPNIEKEFIQRKQYDEYYFNKDIKIELTMNMINELTYYGFVLEITPWTIYIQ